ncbi:serine hydrolase domain-containing protein [Anaerosporobacter faecicola]|uniref:serine hydrolase domain-containing protein n=1 Tax=Anaerosporobacter faecicola TaxID=2718714 RepID=UPI00143BD636|nr:serine hydrolase domain-containing protein [Anaerosporobacter faecicola]
MRRKAQIGVIVGALGLLCTSAPIHGMHIHNNQRDFMQQDIMQQDTMQQDATQQEIAQQDTTQQNKTEQDAIRNKNRQYNIGSVSKIITTTAIMQLVEQKKMDLDEPITTYLPDFTMADERYTKITTRMLLNHTSGLMGSHFKNVMLFEEADSEGRDSLLSALKEERLKAEPGTFAIYCNDGFSLAERIVERISGMSFSEYIERYIFEPLDMQDSSTPELDAKNPERVSLEKAGCYFDKNYQMPYEYCNAIGSGGILSSTEDLCKYAQIFFKNNDGNVLGKEAVDAMLTNEYAKTTYLNLEGESSSEFGLGFDSVRQYPFDQYGIQVVSKSGSVNFHQANLTIAPEYNCSVAILSSGGKGQLDYLISNAILEAILQDKGVMPETVRTDTEYKQEYEKANIPDKIKTYAGIYGGASWYAITFPSDQEMEIASIDEDSQVTATFYYTKDGYFVNEDGYYMGVHALTMQSGQNVSAKAYFKEESDGNVYLCSQCQMEMEGLGVAREKECSLKRQQSIPLDEKIKTAWEKRMGKGYYPVYEKYNSTSWTNTAYEELQFCSRLDGYVKGKKQVEISKILDATHAQDAGMNRDMKDIQFVTKEGIEYMTVGNSAYYYIPQEELKEYTGEDLSWKAKESNTVQWYSIGEDAVGKQKYIVVDGKGALYLYNRYHNLQYTTFMKNGGNTVVIPEGGTMVLVGEQGATIQLQTKE